MPETVTPSQFEDFALVPDDELLVDPDEELTDAFREADDPELDPEVQEPPTLPLGRSWHFDFVNKRLVKYGVSVAETHELETLKMWILHTLVVGRFSSPIYKDDYGMDDPFLLIGEIDTPELRAEYREQVIEALMQHDRILAVDSFTFDRDPDKDYLDVSFVVLLDDEEKIEIKVPLNG